MVSRQARTVLLAANSPRQTVEEDATLSPGESFTTLEARISFLRPVFDGRLVATARVVHRGKTVGFVECDVTNGDGKIVAKTSSTCQVLRGEAVKGRALGGHSEG